MSSGHPGYQRHTLFPLNSFIQVERKLWSCLGFWFWADLTEMENVFVLVSGLFGFFFFFYSELKIVWSFSCLSDRKSLFLPIYLLSMERMEVLIPLLLEQCEAIWKIAILKISWAFQTLWKPILCKFPLIWFKWLYKVHKNGNLASLLLKHIIEQGKATKAPNRDTALHANV